MSCYTSITLQELQKRYNECIGHTESEFEMINSTQGITLSFKEDDQFAIIRIEGTFSCNPKQCLDILHSPDILKKIHKERLVHAEIFPYDNNKDNKDNTKGFISWCRWTSIAPKLNLKDMDAINLLLYSSSSSTDEKIDIYSTSVSLPIVSTDTSISVLENYITHILLISHPLLENHTQYSIEMSSRFSDLVPRAFVFLVGKYVRDYYLDIEKYLVEHYDDSFFLKNL